jgi:oligopeptide/dipeptide ABC transporter ATP-binding protein
MALILITHDLGVVAGIVDRVNVMYAGHVVERATVTDLFADPRHPYSLGLMESIPRIDAVRGERLHPIEGMPPDLIDPPPGCAFQPRCPYAVEQSEREAPSLEQVAPGHWVACWVDVRTAPRRDALATAEVAG